MKLTQEQFNALWEHRAATAVSYDTARAAVFATADRRALMPDQPPYPVWYALVDGRVVEGYDNGCHPAVMPSVYDKTFACAADAMEALRSEPRVSNLQSA